MTAGEPIPDDTMRFWRGLSAISTPNGSIVFPKQRIAAMAGSWEKALEHLTLLQLRRAISIPRQLKNEILILQVNTRFLDVRELLERYRA